MAWKFNFSTTGKYPTTVRKFLVGKDGVERSARLRASMKRTVGGVGEVVEVDDVLQGWRRRRAPGKAIKVEGEAIERHRG
jgi:hypothetical protein